MTVADMLHRMSAMEFRLWTTYYQTKHELEERARQKAKSRK